MKTTKYVLAAGMGLWILGLLLPSTALADTLLYSNGNTKIGNTVFDNRAINEGFEASESFTVTSDSVLTTATVGLVTQDLGGVPGGGPVSVQWSIGTAPGGSDIASGTANFFNVISEGLDPNNTSTSLFLADLNLSGTVDTGTTYYFTLGGATGAQAVAWQITNGPSAAYENTTGAFVNQAGLGTPGSNSTLFQIYGTTVTTTPEPSSLLLLTSGLLGLIGMGLYKKQLA